MSNDNTLQNLMDSETGKRHPSGLFSRNLIWVIALCWSLFQLWVSSPIQFMVADMLNLDIILSDTKIRSIHLSIAIFMVYITFPAKSTSPTKYIPIIDWIFAFFASIAAAYLFLFYSDLANRAGLPSNVDIIFSSIGVISLLEAARRTMGLTISVIAIIFMLYAILGSLMPDIIAHKSNFITEVVTYQWLTTEGAYGIALGVSAGFVFLYVLFGSLLEKAGSRSFLY